MKIIKKYNMQISWFISLCGTIFSLIFSELLKLLPCDLCWYQRMAMYPLVLILGIGMLRKDPQVSSYAFPFTFIGLLISVYQITIQTFPSSSMKTCSVGVSCTEDQLNLFGFITIPMLSFVGFLLITILLCLKSNKS